MIQVLPEAIQTSKEDQEDEEYEGLMYIDKSIIIPVLVKSIQELTQKIQSLEERLNKVEEV